jgi:hypothetical protein
MTTRKIGTILTLILFISCGAKKSTDNNETTTDSTKISDIGQSSDKTIDSVTTDDEVDYSDCIRGQAESVIKNTVYRMGRQ